MTDKIIGYVVVRAPSGLMVTDSAGAVTHMYCGLDRGAWECVDNLYYNKTLAPDLVAIRAKSFKNYVGNYSPGTVESVNEAFQLLSACKASGQESEVIGIIHLGGLGDSDATLDISDFLGVDCYIDGYGSLLALGVFQKPDVFQDFHSCLNQHGLFRSVEALRQYSKVYCERSESANLEPIDDLNEVYVYAVLRQASNRSTA
jgi:hypothetical protein